MHKHVIILNYRAVQHVVFTRAVVQLLVGAWWFSLILWSMKCTEAEEEEVTKGKENLLQLSCFINQEVKYLFTGLKLVSHFFKFNWISKWPMFLIYGLELTSAVWSLESSKKFFFCVCVQWEDGSENELHVNVQHTSTGRFLDPGG